MLSSPKWRRDALSVQQSNAVACTPGVVRCRTIPAPPRQLDQASQCVVEAPAHDAPQVLDEIRAQALPLALIFNRHSVMVLPQGISTATGLGTALEVLRVSIHTTRSESATPKTTTHYSRLAKSA